MSDEIKGLKERLASKQSNRVESVKVHEFRGFTLTCGELRKVCEGNPEHPIVPAFLKGIGNRPDTAELAVDRIDLEAVLDNKDVATENVPATGPNGRTTIVRKKLVPRAKPAPVSPPKKDKGE